jgi:hypothetical protein
MTSGDLAWLVAELAQRVERLEGKRPVPAVSADGEPHVTYSGSGPGDNGTVAWQIIRGWPDILDGTGERSAALFSALASPLRLRIVTELIGGKVATAELARRLDQPSTGQLFHHLKELLAAGVIYQPVRATYAIRSENVVPLLTMLCAAIDIRESPQEVRHDSEHR